MKIIIYIESSSNNIHPVSLESLVAAQQLKKETNGEIHAITFHKNLHDSLKKFILIVLSVLIMQSLRIITRYFI